MNTICDKLLLCLSFLAVVRFKIIDNGHLQIRGIKKTDEGMYNCEARVMARGEIDFRIIKVIVNGKRCIFLLPLPASPVDYKGAGAQGAAVMARKYQDLKEIKSHKFGSYSLSLP